MFTDTHCHLNYQSFDNDLAEVIARANAQGVGRVMIPGIDLPACSKAIQIAEANETCYAAIGIHPNDADQWDIDTYENLRDLSTQSNKVRAIGEIGLDYYRDHVAPQMQREAFASQLQLARELGLPVIVHIRESIANTLDMLFQWQKQLVIDRQPQAFTPGILHAFPGSLKEAEIAIEHHFLIGVGGPVTFKNAKNRQEIVAELPLESIAIETDAPFLAPHPHRGQRNEPSYIPLIAAKIAELKQLPIEFVDKQTAQNAERLFHWED
ncbi:MAG TPA: TatD family deoxyribonuclease [Chloroflexi bacterium]|nr:TatD family deoxyribonuclease [Chloroflexota bacterium]